MSNDTNGTSRPEQYAIGVSFGNSYSSIAHISREGKVEVIANEEGDRQIPSILSYIAGEEYHGTQAKAQLIRNASNTVAYFRDYVGKSYSQVDPTPCSRSAHPSESSGKVVFSVHEKEDSETPSKIPVSEITTRHLRRLATSASDFSGRRVTSAVVAIPTDTTEAQKEALVAAAADAEIMILQFIPEPISALLSYDARNLQEAGASPADKIVLVADLGASRSDAAIIASRSGLYTTLATTHDYSLGGNLLDDVLIEHFAKEFQKSHKGSSDPRQNARSLAKLKLEAESVKKALSQSASATFSVESLADGHDFRSTINRTRYQLVALKTFQRFTRLLEELVAKAGLDVLDIDQVILSGGTSHTPKIAENIQALFPESTQILAPSTETSALNPSELAARGAAIQASMIQEFDKEDIEQSTHEMVTVTPHTTAAIGVQVTGMDQSDLEVMVPEVTAVPARKSRVVEIKESGDVLIRIVEGKGEIKVTRPEPKPKTNGASVEDAKDNDVEDDDDDDYDDDEDNEVREKSWKIEKTLAEFKFEGLKKGAKVEVVVNVDSNLGLNVSAREVGGKGGVRGTIDAPQVTANGKA